MRLKVAYEYPDKSTPTRTNIPKRFTCTTAQGTMLTKINPMIEMTIRFIFKELSRLAG